MTGRREVPDDRMAVLYRQLMRAYGPQGWWPVAGHAGRDGHDARGYHRGLFGPPDTPAARFEVIMGAVLTQNTAWTNVELALRKLREARIRLPADVLACPQERLAGLIRSSGYFNQKARRLKTTAAFFLQPGRLSGARPPARDELRALSGIGPETADSILLYAFHEPTFVVDAYTRRILQRMGMLEGREGYGDIQGLFHRSLPRSERRYNEFHALIVAHGKQRCSPRPDCSACPVKPCAHGDTVREKPRLT